MIDAIDSPACSTLPQWRAINATPNRIAPHNTVAYFARLNQVSSVAAPRHIGFKKSITVVDASEFSAARQIEHRRRQNRRDHQSCATPTGSLCQMNGG